jgi:hypothetical protein
MAGENTWRDTRHMWSLMFVCRKLYGETRLLPFQLGRFYVSDVPDSIRRLSELLTITQMEAIATIRVNCKAISYSTPGELFMLGQLKGLKRVIISYCARRVDPGLHEYLMSLISQHCEVGNLEVVLEYEE